MILPLNILEWDVHQLLGLLVPSRMARWRSHKPSCTLVLAGSCPKCTVSQPSGNHNHIMETYFKIYILNYTPNIQSQSYLKLYFFLCLYCWLDFDVMSSFSSNTNIYYSFFLVVVLTICNYNSSYDSPLWLVKRLQNYEVSKRNSKNLKLYWQKQECFPTFAIVTILRWT